MPDKLDAVVCTDGDGRPVRIADLLARFASEGSLRVSDLHLKVASPPIYRVDGQLQPAAGQPLSREQVRLVAEALLTEPEMEEVRETGAADSSCLTQNVQFRINCFRDADGLAVAIRALDPKPVEVEKIGFPNLVWQDIVNRQWGLVLVTGITGAGKSTTIASLVDRIVATRPVRVITLEDPIEYLLPSRAALVSQREVGRTSPASPRACGTACGKTPTSSSSARCAIARAPPGP
jgi:twitching motility protein PilT